MSYWIILNYIGYEATLDQAVRLTKINKYTSKIIQTMLPNFYDYASGTVKLVKCLHEHTNSNLSNKGSGLHKKLLAIKRNFSPA